MYSGTYVFGAPLPLIEDGLPTAVKQVELHVGVRIGDGDRLHCQVGTDSLTWG